MADLSKKFEYPELQQKWEKIYSKCNKSIRELFKTLCISIEWKDMTTARLQYWEIFGRSPFRLLLLDTKNVIYGNDIKMSLTYNPEEKNTDTKGWVATIASEESPVYNVPFNHQRFYMQEIYITEGLNQQNEIGYFPWNFHYNSSVIDLKQKEIEIYDSEGPNMDWHNAVLKTMEKYYANSPDFSSFHFLPSLDWSPLIGIQNINHGGHCREYNELFKYLRANCADFYSRKDIVNSFLQFNQIEIEEFLGIWECFIYDFYKKLNPKLFGLILKIVDSSKNPDLTQQDKSKLETNHEILKQELNELNWFRSTPMVQTKYIEKNAPYMENWLHEFSY